MATFALPLEAGNPHQTFTCALDGANYGFAFHWNETDESWFASIYDSAGNPLSVGQAVRADWFLFLRNLSPSMPPGQITIVDTSGAGLDPGLADLGERVQIVYYGTTGGPR